MRGGRGVTTGFRGYERVCVWLIGESFIFDCIASRGHFLGVGFGAVPDFGVCNCG